VPSNRIRFRELVKDSPDSWSWFNRSQPIVVRFPIFFSGKGVSREQFWECHRYQDMVSIPKRLVPVPAKGSLHAFQWFRKAKKLYPTAAFVGALLGVPTTTAPPAFLSILVTLLNATISSMAAYGGRAAGDAHRPHVLLHAEPPRRTTTATQRKVTFETDESLTIVSRSAVGTLPLEFSLAFARDRPLLEPRGKPIHGLTLFNNLIHKSVMSNTSRTTDDQHVPANGGGQIMHICLCAGKPAATPTPPASPRVAAGHKKRQPSLDTNAAGRIHDTLRESSCSLESRPTNVSSQRHRAYWATCDFPSPANTTRGDGQCEARCFR
jgi:hypothetical protein